MGVRELFMTLLAVVALASCNVRRGTLPRSGGNPYEVTVVGDVDSIVYRALSTDMDGLPQSEPIFDVREAKVEPSEALDGVLRYARVLVVVDINPRKYSEVSLGVRHNVYADPQVILVLCSPSSSALSDTAGGCTLGGFADKVVGRLLAHERSITIASMRRKHNPKMEAEVRRMFGFDMLIPPDMTSVKRGKDFLWVSNNSPTAMLNICVYGGSFSDRDSIMRVNIKGETDSMYMATVHGACTVTYNCFGGFAEHDWRGLWEMHGDAMGGPLVARTILQGLGRRTPVTVEGFVYAPGRNKRNHVMLLEAVLQTVKKRGGSAQRCAETRRGGKKPVHGD